LRLLYTPKRYKKRVGTAFRAPPLRARLYFAKRIRNPWRERWLIKIKKRRYDAWSSLRTHPFDVIGWDGYNFPYGFSIHNFEPITGRIHQPPPVHQTFETATFVVCSFVPRLYDYHPKSVPAPYNHSNIDSDEVLYYVESMTLQQYRARTYHFTPGIPHGPAPGAMERSIGHKETEN
jgi:homogentisate 1,2-dioxygenase